MHIIFGQYALHWWLWWHFISFVLSALQTSHKLHMYYFTMKGFVYKVYCIFLQDQRKSSPRRARYQFPPFSPLCPDPPPVPRSRGKRGQLPERAPPDPANQISRLSPPVQCQKGNSRCPNGRHHGWKRGNQPPTPMQGLKNQGVRDKWRLFRVHKRH